MIDPWKRVQNSAGEDIAAKNSWKKNLGSRNAFAANVSKNITSRKDLEEKPRS